MNIVKLLVLKRIIIKGLSKPMSFLLWGFIILFALATALDTILN
jgi:hypothetical protein